MDTEHVDFFGLRTPRMSAEQFEAMELGFMWCAVREMMLTVNQDRILICLPARFGAEAMQMGDLCGLTFTLGDACRSTHLHVIYAKPEGFHAGHG